MTLKFGYERRDWDAAKSEIVAILGERVRSGRGPMTYGELAGFATPLSVTVFILYPGSGVMVTVAFCPA